MELESHSADLHQDTVVCVKLFVEEEPKIYSKYQPI